MCIYNGGAHILMSWDDVSHSELDYFVMVKNLLVSYYQ